MPPFGVSKSATQKLDRFQEFVIEELRLCAVHDWLRGAFDHIYRAAVPVLLTAINVEVELAIGILRVLLLRSLFQF